MPAPYRQAHATTTKRGNVPLFPLHMGLFYSEEHNPILPHPLRPVPLFCEYYPVLGTTRAGYPTSGRGPVPNLKSGSGEQIGAVRQLPRAQLTSSMDGPHWHAQLVPQSRWCGMTGLDSGQLRSFYTLRARARALRHRQPAVQLCAPERPKSCHSTPLAPGWDSDRFRPYESRD